MSSRALRRLRQERGQEEHLLFHEKIEEDPDLSQDESNSSGDDDGDDDDLEEEEEVVEIKVSQFQLSMDSSSEEESESDDDDADKDATLQTKLPPTKSKLSKPSLPPKQEEDEEEEEDIDDILSEFLQPGQHPHLQSYSTETTLAHEIHTLLSTRDIRDFDLEYTMRAMLGGMGEPMNAGNAGNENARGRSRNKFVFGQVKHVWGTKRPPSYVGGGLGMEFVEMKKTQSKDPSDDDKQEDSRAMNNESQTEAPWPYCHTHTNESHPPKIQILPQAQQSWYTFTQSKTYQAKLAENQTYISNTGDVNALAAYIADNPYMVEALLQLSMFFFGFNELEHGTDLLQRMLWIWECCAWSGFFPSPTTSGTGSNQKKKKATLTLLDYNQAPNDTFFSTLFRYIQRSNALGCVTTALAVSRFMLSLDIYRDPMGVLMIMDYFALSTRRAHDVRFVVKMVESEWMGLCYRYETFEGVHEDFGMIRDLPNWAFSYALALYQLHEQYWDDEDEEVKEELNEKEEEDEDEEDAMTKASKALQYAIRKFPMVPRLLLDANNVNINNRSCAIDWPSVLGPLDNLYYRYQREFSHVSSDTKKAIDHIMDIFAKRSHTLWSDEKVLEWLYKGCVAVVNDQIRKEVETEELEGGNEETQEGEWNVSPAIARYLRFDASDFEDSVRTLPADANPLNPQLVDPIFNIRDQQHRRRLLRRPRDMERQQEHQDGRVVLGGGRGIEFGVDRSQMEVLDPDLPLMELFWRSFLPWNRVAGIVPARRHW